MNEHRGRVVACVVALTVAGGACTTTFYEGRRELVGTDAPKLQSVGTVIDEIDGTDVRAIRLDGALYLLSPGPHVIGFSLLRSPLIDSSDRASDHVRVCLVARPSHRYRTAAERRPQSRSWTPLILESDEGSGAPPPRRAPLDCARDRLFAQTNDPGPPSTASSSNQVQNEPDHYAVAPASPAAAPVAGMDETLRLRSRPAIVRYDPHPSVDLWIGVGLAYGGRRWDFGLPTDPGPGHMGTGLFLNGGAMVTPLWRADRIGFGAGLELGLKPGATPDNHIGLKRYPAAATVHSTLRLTGRSFVMLGLGLAKDFGVTYEGNETPASPLTSSIGEIARVRLYYRAADSSALMVALTDTWLRYESTANQLDAGSIALDFGFVFAL